MATLNDEVAAATAAAMAKAAKLVPRHQHPVNKGRSPESRLGLKGKNYSPHDVLGPILDSMKGEASRLKACHGATNLTVVERANAARAKNAEKAKKQRVAAKAAQAKDGGDAAGPSSPAA